MTRRPGDVPIHRFFTPDEIAEIDSHTIQEGDTAMPNRTRTPLPLNATREDKLAALPPLAGAGGNPGWESRLGRLADSALDKLSELDTALEDLAEEFAIRFHDDDERAATRERISTTARAHRTASRRG